MLTTLNGRRIVFLGYTQPDKMHDKRLIEADAPSFPPGSRGIGDLAYLGYQPAHLALGLPLKKPKKAELSSRTNSSIPPWQKFACLSSMPYAASKSI